MSDHLQHAPSSLTQLVEIYFEGTPGDKELTKSIAKNIDTLRMRGDTMALAILQSNQTLYAIDLAWEKVFPPSCSESVFQSCWRTQRLPSLPNSSKKQT